MKALKSTSRGQGRLGDQPSEGQVFAPRKLLLTQWGIALISYIPATMQYLHFHHPWWSNSGVNLDAEFGS